VLQAAFPYWYFSGIIRLSALFFREFPPNFRVFVCWNGVWSAVSVLAVSVRNQPFIALAQLPVEILVLLSQPDFSQSGIVDAMNSGNNTTSCAPDRLGRSILTEGDLMDQQSVRLGPREQQIVELLLQGCDNAEIARQLKMARRTVKAHFNRLFLRFGIHGGIKRVKLATLLYRRQLCLQGNVTDHVSQMSANSVSSSLSHKA
jgi:DNA-binding NarL/FixJ family response regulator